MERFKDLPKINVAKRNTKTNKLELVVGAVTEFAEIAVMNEAYAELFEKEGEVYSHLTHQVISQHGASRHRPKKFQVYVLGVIDAEKEQSLVYAQSMLDDTDQVNVIRVTPVQQITKYRNLIYLD